MSERIMSRVGASAALLRPEPEPKEVAGRVDSRAVPRLQLASQHQAQFNGRGTTPGDLLGALYDLQARQVECRNAVRMSCVCCVIAVDNVQNRLQDTKTRLGNLVAIAT